MQVGNSDDLPASPKLELDDPSVGTICCPLEESEISNLTLVFSSCRCSEEVFCLWWLEFWLSCWRCSGLTVATELLALALGKTEQRQSGQVEFVRSQWYMQSAWKMCLHKGTWCNSSWISKSPKQTQHLQSFQKFYWLDSAQEIYNIMHAW